MNIKKNKILQAQANKENQDIKDNINNDLKDKKDSIYESKKDYALNNISNPDKQNITTFNIRVLDNQVRTSNNKKINKNNAFYFSKYSRFNDNK